MWLKSHSLSLHADVLALAKGETIPQQLKNDHNKSFTSTSIPHIPRIYCSILLPQSNQSVFFLGANHLTSPPHSRSNSLLAALDARCGSHRLNLCKPKFNQKTNLQQPRQMLDNSPPTSGEIERVQELPLGKIDW